MIKFYSWSTPNGRKVAILLEELGIDYAVYPINLEKNEQLNKKYEKISPSNKIPAIVDTENNRRYMPEANHDNWVGPGTIAKKIEELLLSDENGSLLGL